MPPFLPVNDPQILIFQYFKGFHCKAVRVVVASYRIDKIATGYKAAFRDIRFADNELPGIRGNFVGIGIEVAQDTVHL
jgi:hypothetical protein